jgi:hypothetical protein
MDVMAISAESAVPWNLQCTAHSLHPSHNRYVHSNAIRASPRAGIIQVNLNLFPSGPASRLSETVNMVLNVFFKDGTPLVLLMLGTDFQTPLSV